MKQIVLATNNSGKAHELQTMLAGYNIEIIPQSKFNIPSVAETGLTYIENALLKARNAVEKTNLPAIGDDSGLIVDALNGEPGLHTAYYAGENATAEQHIKKLLHEMRNVPDEKRTARFYCVLVYLRSTDDPMPIIAEGVCEGRILSAPRGTAGFGYDPVFYLPSHDCSCAELAEKEKNQLSHRGKALQELVKRLRYRTQSL